MDLNYWLVLAELIAWMLVCDDSHEALRSLFFLTGTNKAGMKSDTTEVWMCNHGCHSCMSSFYLGLSNNILYNLNQGCGWTIDVPDSLYSKNKFG